MEPIVEFLQTLKSSHLNYLIALALIVIWWVGRFFVQLFREAGRGGRIERANEPERPRRRIPLD
jgi:hypothetical protein